MSRSTRRIFVTLEVLLALAIVTRLFVTEPDHADAQRPRHRGVHHAVDASDPVDAGDVQGDTRRVVLLAGDSIMRQTGPAIDNRFGPDVTVENEGVNGSGLLTPSLFDWVGRLQQLVAEQDPDVVVLLFIGNYTNTDFWTGAEGQPVPQNTLAFYAAWSQQADRLMQVLEPSDADVYWVLPPPEFTELNKEITTRLRQVYTQLAQRWPRIHLIDANEGLAGPNGEYIGPTTDGNGEVVPLRATDTVHLTEAGADRLAQTISQQIAPSL